VRGRRDQTDLLNAIPIKVHVGLGERWAGNERESTSPRRSSMARCGAGETGDLKAGICTAKHAARLL